LAKVLLVLVEHPAALVLAPHALWTVASVVAVALEEVLVEGVLGGTLLLLGELEEHMAVAAAVAAVIRLEVLFVVMAQFSIIRTCRDAILAVQVVLVRFALFGLEQHVHSHQLAQVIFNK
jgi:hypothetical protein